LLYILYGPDDYSRQARLQELRQQWDDAESLGLNTTVLQSQQLEMADLRNVCDAVPFLGSIRLVIVEGLLGQFEQREAAPANRLREWQRLADYATRMPATTALVLTDGKLSKKNQLLKKLLPVAKVEEFPTMKGADLHKWVQTRVRAQGAKISPRAVSALTETGGDNLWALSNEIDKLCLYARGRTIQEEDVHQVTSYSREATVFAMADAFAEKRSAVAMRLMHQLLAEGMTPPQLLFWLTRQFRLIVQAREMASQGLSPAEKLERLGVAPNYPINRLTRQSARYNLPRLSLVYQKLLETDLAIKTGKLKDTLALDLLVAEICS